MDFLKDLGLTAVAALSAQLVVTAVAVGVYRPLFWIVVAILISSLVLAKRKAIVGVTVLILVGGFSYSGILARAVLEHQEEQVMTALRSIREAEKTFKGRSMKFGSLPELIGAGLITQDLADGVYADYQLGLTATATAYEVVASPITRDDRLAYGWSFFLDESGIIRGAAYGKMNNYRRAGPGDNAIRQERQ
jgi:hypothetical protein